MSLVFSSERESDRNSVRAASRAAPGNVGQICSRLVSPARALLSRPGAGKQGPAERVGFRARMSRGETEIRTQFDRVSNAAGLTEDERVFLVGDSGQLSRVILGLETVLAAFDLLGGPVVAAAWLRWNNPVEPFDGRSPLRLMAQEGRFGVEITLLYLRAQLRLALDRVEGAERASA